LMSPYAPADLAPLPAGVEVLLWDGDGPLPGSAADVEFFVPPYSVRGAGLDPLGELPSLRVVQVQTAGVDHVVGRLPAGVTLCNARGVHDASTAELAMTLMLSALRGVPGFVRAQDAGEWRAGWRPALADKTVLIVG